MHTFYTCVLFSSDRSSSCYERLPLIIGEYFLFSLSQVQQGSRTKLSKQLVAIQVMLRTPANQGTSEARKSTNAETASILFILLILKNSSRERCKWINICIKGSVCVTDSLKWFGLLECADCKQKWQIDIPLRRTNCFLSPKCWWNTRSSLIRVCVFFAWNSQQWWPPWSYELL